jgi:hypothetical protein
MAFVQITTVPQLEKEKYDQIIESAYGSRLARGEMFRVAGPGKDAWYVIDGWLTRKDCDDSLEKLVPALQAAGLAMESMAVEEFEVHAFKAQ